MSEKGQILRSVTLAGSQGQKIKAGVSDYPSGTGWWVATADDGAMEGWWDPPSPRAEAVDRPQANGAFAPAILLTGPRVLTLVLHHVADTHAEEQAARALLSQMAQDWVTLTVEEDWRTYTVQAFASAQAKVKHLAGNASTWSLVLTCPDPLKYEGNGAGPGQAGSAWKLAEYAWRDGGGGALFKAFDQSPRQDATTSNQPRLLFTGVQSLALEVDNTGGVPAWPVLEAVGPLRRMSWKLNGHVVEWNRPVPAGALLRIDTKTGEVTINGARERLSGLSEDDFFALPVGRSIVALDMDQPAMARVRWLQAWM